jgi:D-alanyl-D-alanine carboxypeptidase
VVASLAAILVAVPRAHAGHALVDALDGTTLEATEPRSAVAAERALELLLVEVVRERIAAGALRFASVVPMTVVGDDATAARVAHGHLAVGELLQLVLLNRSRSALSSLATAAGPGPDQARARLRRAALRLGLHDTAVPDRWPQEVSGAARTTVGDLARLVGALVQDAELRRRLTLDGSPIADGALIVRTTDPLIACAPPAEVPRPAGARPATLGADPPAALALESRDGLDLLAVASGDDAPAAVWRTLEDGFARYRRVELVHAGTPVGADIEVKGGATDRFTAIAAQAFALTVPRHGPFSLNAWLQLPGRVLAPVEANQSVGELIFAQGGTIVGAVPLVAPASIAPSGWIDTARR